MSRPRSNDTTERLITISALTKDLEEAVQPDRLEDALASLKFRRTIHKFIVGETLTKITFRASRMLMLVEALSLPQEER